MSQSPETAAAKKTTAGFRPVVIACAVMLVLLAAVAFLAVSHYSADVADKRAAFEKVLNMSGDELESKTVAELNGYRQDIDKAAHYSLALGNVSGYDKAVVDQKLGQVQSLLLKKTSH